MTKRPHAHRLGILLVASLGIAACSDNTDNPDDNVGTTGIDDGTSSNGLPQQIQDELAATAATLNAATASSVRSVHPVLKCVDKIAGTNNYRAHLGYTNSASASVTIPVGFFNRFYPNPSGRGQQTVFSAGAQADVIQIVFARTSSISWILGLSFQTATANSKLCTATGGTGGSGTGGSAGAGGRGGSGTGGAAGAGGRGGSGTGGATAQCPSTCDDHNPCTVDTCNASTGFLCTNVAGPDGITCTDNNACTTGDKCVAGVCAPGTARVCAAIDQCHTAGVCNPTSGACSTPVAADGAACSDGNACTTGDACRSGACVGGAAKVCPAPGPCHTTGVCVPSSGACTNPNAPDGTACDDGLMCTLGDACLAGACTPSTTLPPTHCVGGAACDGCTADNCIPDFAGCDQIGDAGDRLLCENLYACLTNPANACLSFGDPTACWCGSNAATCFTDNAPPTQANGPCVQQIIAAAKTTDAATIRLRLVDPGYPIGRAVNLTECRGEFCALECSVQ